MLTLRHPARAIALVSGIALAGLPGSVAHAETLQQLVEAATQRIPELAVIEARRDTAAAKRSAAAAFTPGPPVFGGRYITDQVVRNRNAREAEITVSTPLWLPGEGSASRRVADAEFARLAAQEAALKLKVAGQVREAAANVVLAQSDLRVAEKRFRDARTLEADVARRVAARDLAEADLLTSRADRITADAELREKKMALDQARIELASITGLSVTEVTLQEPEPPKDATPHPRLGEGRSAMDLARANLGLVNTQSRENLEIGLVGRHARDINGTQWNTSVGVELRIPFGNESRNAPRRTAALADVAEATAGHLAVEREIEAEQRKTRVAFDNAVVQRDLARDRAAVLARQRELAEVSYRRGQTGLPDLIRVRALASEAEAGAERAKIGIAQARGKLNQSLGITP